MRTALRQLYILFVAVFLAPACCLATSTSGTVSRTINTIDGIINTGALPGSNPASGEWETDEVFVGFQGAVNWHLSWDDNNLYLGRLNGNNAEGSLIYLRADKTGLSFSNTVQNYDGFSPQFNNLSGINFVAYIKDTYDEFRTFAGGAWSGPNTSLVPHFGNTSVGGVNQASMEISIPWNTITNGNGKPDNLRAVFYQVAPGLFAYGESPFGTGLSGNGPTVGVNDGAPSAAAQPGGNVASSPQITRWWGCYPVIGGVGANGFVAVSPDAGNDIEICSTQNSITLNGNAPAAEAIGTWAVASVPAGAATPVIANPNQRNSQVSGFTQYGVYKLVWNINYGRCPALPDTVNIIRLQTPADAFAGTDTTLLCGNNSLQLNGNDPGPQQNFSGGTVSWQVIQGNATLSNPSSPAASLGNIGAGTTRVVYRIQNNSCTSAPDTISVFRYATPNANAGSNQNFCGNSSTLSGNNPLLIQSTASGQWSTLSSPGTAVFTNAQQYNTTVNGLVQGTYIFQWKVSNGNCPADSSTVSITVATPALATAGSNINVCGQTALALLANNPTPASGTWTQISGPAPAVFSNVNSNNPSLSQLQAGTYTFQWKVSSPGCPADSDRVNVTIYKNPAPFARDGQVKICGSSARIEAVNPADIQFTAYGRWKIVSAPSAVSLSSTTSFSTQVNGISANGVYVLSYVLYNGNCDSAECRFTITKSDKQAMAIAKLTKPGVSEFNGSIEVYPPVGSLSPVTYQINYHPEVGPVFDSLASGTYYITARDANGCTADTLVDLVNGFFVPTGISPNGDNINDTWEIPGLNEYPDCRVTIYNIWGAVVFSSIGYKEPWEGTLDNKKLPTGNYYYTIELSSKEEPLKGKITLAR